MSRTHRAEPPAETPSGVPVAEPEAIEEMTSVEEAPTGVTEVVDIEGAKEERPGPSGVQTTIAHTDNRSACVILAGPASYGPITVGGKLVRAKKGEPLCVADPDERLAILGLPMFRAATAEDLAPNQNQGPLTTQALNTGGLRR